MNILMIKLSPIDGLNSSMMRTIALANGFSELNYNIDFLTIPSSDTHTIDKNKKYIKTLNVIYTNNNKIYDQVITNSNKYKTKQFIVSSLRYIYHKLSIFNYTKKIADTVEISILPKKSYDLIISVSDPKTSHIAAKKLIEQGLSYTKWVQYWGDPLTLDITNKNIYPNTILKHFEKNLFSNSNLIIYASPITLEKQKTLFPVFSNRMVFLPTPYIKEKQFNIPTNSKMEIGYFGAYNTNIRNINPLYEACKELEESVNLTIVGNSDTILEETSNVKILERQVIDSYEEKSNLIVCILNKTGTQIPGKVFHYAATNKPILLILDGEFSNEIGEYFLSYNRYYITDNNKDDIKSKIVEIQKNNKKFHPLKDFSSQRISKKIVSLLGIKN